jgi:hypothetical protein
MKRVLMGGPVQEDVRIFKEHLKSLDELNTDGLQVDRFWILNDAEELKPFLKPSEYIEFDTGDIYIKDEKTHYWTDKNISKMEILRNKMIRKTIDDGYDYLFFVDSDLILHPETLQQLIRDDKDAVAEIFWTASEPGKPLVWTNCWMYDQCDSEAEDYKTWLDPGVYKVGGTGACFLIKRKVLEAGADYARPYNIRKILRGEDRWFCLKAAVLGFEIYIDTHYPATHLYREAEYNQYMEAKYGTH